MKAAIAKRTFRRRDTYRIVSIGTRITGADKLIEDLAARGAVQIVPLTELEERLARPAPKKKAAKKKAKATAAK